RRITIFGKRMNLYASTPAPNNLDDAIDFAREELKLEAPAADLLYADPYKVMMEDVVSGKYIAKEPIGNQMCDHLAFRGNHTDWQIWVSDASLPCRYVITTKDVKGMPDFSVTFANWKMSPTFPDSEFEFTPPAGATQIEFLKPQRGDTKQEKL